MIRVIKVVLSCLILVWSDSLLSGQTFTFECKCEHLADSLCDVCGPNLTSRSFHGLLIRRNGLPYRWIDEPYLIKQLPGETIQFLEQIPNPDNISIARWQTQFATMQGYLDSTTCFCSLGGAMDTVVVDTPIIGNGTPGNPITIGQFGADTTMFLNWNGQYWYPAKVAMTDLKNDLPYFLNDDDAIAGGLLPGKTYLLAPGNTFALPTGLYKVVIGCGYDCDLALAFYISDAQASAGGVPAGREYVLAQGNAWGLLYGFVKAIGSDPPADTLHCNTVLPEYVSDPAAIIGGLADGDFYTVTAPNAYGAPEGVVRVVSTTATTSADPPFCCSDTATLPYYKNDTAAISGGLSSGYYYYLSTDNTLGYPYGTKKVIP